MKKALTLCLAFLLILGVTATALAVDTSREYLFELSVDGSDTKQVKTGDIITVVFTLKRTDSSEDALMYAMQNEIRYDSNFFELVEGSALLSPGISTTDIGLRDSYREFYMNFLSLSGGESWEAERMIGSFRLKVIAESGVSKITNQDYLVSNVDGSDSFAASCQDVTIILSTECTVDFESNGGSKVDSQTVYYGEKIEKPEDPLREGYSFVGWYSDIDLKNPWDFENGIVEGNMTLYAKWQKNSDTIPDDAQPDGGAQEPKPEKPAYEGSGGTIGLVLLGVLLVAVLVAFAVVFMNKKTIKFVTGCSDTIEDQRVKKGGFVQRPAEPKREGRMFAGWYTDELYLNRWDFEEDKVTDNMTLYAKWI